VGNILTKAAALRINLNIDGMTIPFKSHRDSPVTLANLSSINLVSTLLGYAHQNVLFDEKTHIF
jgi:hypothetical protein